MVKNHKELKVWHSSVELAVEIYKLTCQFPPEEKFGMVGQMRSAAVSIASKIAVGAARGSRKDLIRLLNISAGSASELDTHLEIRLKLKMRDCPDIGRIKEHLDNVARMIQGLIRSLR